MADPNLARVIQAQARLQALYDRFAWLDRPDKLDAVREILSRVGEVDLASEGLESAENQRDLSIRFHWGHDHRFCDALRVEGRMGDRHVRVMAEFMAAYGLHDNWFDGKDVIDVGCWTGGTTFMLKALGARRVLALEEVQKYARAADDLVNGVYELDDVHCEGGNLYEFETDTPYDVAYCPGVVYHLSDPVLGLRRLFNGLRDGGEIFVESKGYNTDNVVCRFEGRDVLHPGGGERPGAFDRGGWNWFVPSPPCLAAWMTEAGFTGVDCYFSPVSGRVFGRGRRRQHVPMTRAGFSVPDIE